MHQDNDDTQSLLEQVQQAAADATPINIVGGNSKSFLGVTSSANTLSTLNHSGIVTYEPTELVVTVRAGTSLETLTSVLQERGQMLAFEPPRFEGGTIGGVLACGMSGPRRPFTGAARDFVLGMRVINGQAQALRFGGEVMKNVAGYDAARLQVGAFGSLGVLLEASMKVLPLPQLEMTLQHSVPKPDKLATLRQWLRTPLPLSAAAIDGDSQYVRLSGSEQAVKKAAKDLGGEVLLSTDSDAFWSQLRDLKHPFFSDSRTLWRISVPDFTPELALSGDWLLDWAGAQRWLKSDAPADDVFAAAAQAGGHATRYRSGSTSGPVFQPISGAMLQLQRRLRDSFDQKRLFNPGRFHPELDHRQTTQTTGEA